MCVYVHMYVCTYVCVYMRVHVCVWVCVCVHMYIYIYIYIYVGVAALHGLVACDLSDRTYGSNQVRGVRGFGMLRASC